MKNFISLLGSTLILASSVAAHGACDIEPVGSSSPGYVEIKIDGSSNASYRDFLRAIQINPSLFPLTQLDGDQGAVIDPLVLIDPDKCQPPPNDSGSCHYLKIRPKYVPPYRRRVMTDGTTHYTIDDMSNQFVKQWHIPDGADTDVYLYARSENRAQLEKFMNSLPSCQTGGSSSSGDADGGDTQSAPPSSAPPSSVPVQPPTQEVPTSTHGGYMKINGST